MFDLKGKVAVVTGASSGLGADAARAYAEAGAKVGLLARRKDKLEGVAADIKAAGGEALAVECDITDEASVEAAMKAVADAFGSIHILLNNAGVATRGGVKDMSLEDWDHAFKVNVDGVFLASKYVLPYMVEQEYGKIVNISSINARIADKDDNFIRHAYNATKNAVLGISLGMACSYGKYNITVNSVGPGLFESEMTKDSLFKSESWLAGYSSQCPMSRPAKRGELNGTLLYLSSDASSYVTGQYILVDGGTSLV